MTTIALPFPYTLYDQTFNSVNLSSNGNAQFVTTDTTFTNVCLPWAAHNYTIFPYWDDLVLVNSARSWRTGIHIGNVALRPTASSTSNGARSTSPRTRQCQLRVEVV